MKIRCPFLGCNGIIDLDKVFKDFQDDMWTPNQSKNKIKNVPWVAHTIICKKYGNGIGDIDLGPDTWISLKTPPSAFIRDPVTKKEIEIKNYMKHKLHNRKKLLNPYLKEWAKI